MLPYFYFAFNIFIILGGYLYNSFFVKKLKKHTLYIMSVCMLIASLFAMALANNIWIFALSLFFFEVFLTIYMISFSTIEYQHYPLERRSALVSAMSFVVSMSSSIFFTVIGLLIYTNYIIVLIPLLLIIFIIIFNRVTYLMKQEEHTGTTIVS